MKRLISAVVLGLAVAALLLVHTTELAREREYARLLAEGEAALADEELFVAIEAFSGAIALKPESMLGYLKRGVTYRRRGDLPSARRDLRTAVRLDPAATRPLETLGDVNYAMHRYARAAARYAEYVRLDDRSARVLYKLGLARYREGDLPAATAALRRALAVDGELPEAHYLLGLCLREEGDPAGAVTALARAAALYPGLVQAREELADLHRALGRPAEEIEQLEALATLEPGRWQRLVGLGLGYARAGRTDQAVLTLGRAAEQHPEQPQVYVALGRVWLQVAETRGDEVALRKALEALEGAAGTAGGSEALALFGRAVLLSGDAARGERLLRQATARLPADPAAYVWLSEAALDRGDAAEAREALVRYEALATVLAGTPQRAAVAARIGELSLQLGDAATAVAWFRRAVDAGPIEAGLLGRLADAQWRAGEHDAARATLARALAIEPRHPALRALQRRLR